MARRAKHQENNTHKETKLCVSCGRIFHYQRRWEKTWAEVRYCSKSCRQDKLEKRDALLEDHILKLLNTQKNAVDPSEIEIQLETENYKNLKERIRRAARRLVAKGKIDILQKGKMVDASSAKGPIEVRLK